MSSRGGFLEDSDDSGNDRPPKKAKFIDDAAEDEDAGSDDDEDDEEDTGDYVRDDFVVDKIEAKERDDLEDSDDDDDDRKRKLKTMRRLQVDEKLDEDDLALIQEAQGGGVEQPVAVEEEAVRPRVVARNADELGRSLFDDAEEDAPTNKPTTAAATRSDRISFDDDAVDDFIEDDIGDQDRILASERRYDDDNEGGVSEAQLMEASEIFGSDYLEFAQEEEEENKEAVDAMDDDDDLHDDDSDDGLESSDDDDNEPTTDAERQVLKLKREKRQLLKQQRHKESLQKKQAARRARLKQQFEPVQLMENFCTDRDEDIRNADIPERWFGKSVPYTGRRKVEDDNVELTESERSHAAWIVQHVPELALTLTDENKEDTYTSILHALRFCRVDWLEVDFVRVYRQDYVNPKVRDELHAVLEQDEAYHEMMQFKQKVQGQLNNLAVQQAPTADTEKLKSLETELQQASSELDHSRTEREQLKGELTALGAIDDDDDDDDDDDELFGDDDDNVGCIVLLYPPTHPIIYSRPKSRNAVV